MIETIPNPLADAGVKKEIEDKTAELMERTLRFGNINDNIRKLIKTAAEWGMSEGFRMGWRVYEVRNERTSK